MEQSKRRQYLIKALLKENGLQDSETELPGTEEEQKRWLRGLMNVRMPKAVSTEFEKIQDEYLQEELAKKGVVRLEDLQPVQPGLYLWRGDITRLAVDAIVNAANSGMLGCFVPCHGCIDNAIHSAAGIQLRLECARIMQKQQEPEPTGRAKITPAYNLPCRYVLHTVGPIVSGRLTEKHRKQLADCYRSCLELAADKGLKSIAFCCISTGEFHFPQEEAAKIAVRTVKDFMHTDQRMERVVFNVFKQEDYDIYQKLLG